MDRGAPSDEFNPAAEAMFGWRSADVLGQPVRDVIVPPAYREAHADGFKRYLSGAPSRIVGQRVEIEALRSDGTILPVEITVTEIRVEARRLFFANIRDLTARKAAEAEAERQREALHQSEKMTALGSLLSGIAHELNNPLAVVVGRAIMLEEQAADPEMVEGLAQLRHAAERCAKISRTFLAMARQSAPKRSRASLNALVDSALELTGYSLRSAGIAIEQELDPDLPDVFVEQDQIVHVLMNLIINAQQAMAETTKRRRLTVGTRRGQAAGSVVMTIADSGPGMEAEVARRIFEPFYTTKPIGQGTGVGLSISHSIITAHGGTLDVDTQPGAGATLIITLPEADASTSLAAGEAPASRSRSGLSVLVIDDEPDVASTIADILERDGVRVVTAPDGRTGLELIARQPFDAVLCDLRMPVMDGPQFQRRLQALHPGLAMRLVFMSGDLLGAGVTATNGAFGRPLLEKPFAPGDVRAAVTAVVGPR